MVTPPHVLTVYNGIFNDMDSSMQALAKQKTQLNEDLYFAKTFAWQKLYRYHAEVTPLIGMLPLFSTYA